MAVTSAPESEEGLDALQTSVIVTGLPFAMIAFVAARNLYKQLKIDSNKI